MSTLSTSVFPFTYTNMNDMKLNHRPFSPFAPLSFSLPPQFSTLLDSQAGIPLGFSVVNKASLLIGLNPRLLCQREHTKAVFSANVHFPQ